MFNSLSSGRLLSATGLFLVALASLCSGARAQDYQLGPRDVLSVTVLRHPELSADKIEVDPGGRIRLPFVGSILAAGKTTSEVTSLVRNGLTRQLNNPTVTVTILQTRPRQISVSGAVKNPGLFEIGSNWRISEAIAAAGGLTTSPETASATFSRSGSPAVTVSLLNVLRNSGSSENRLLRAGDNLRVIESTIPIRVAGQVTAPGALEVPRGSSIDDAIALAGGFTAGASRAVTVTRKSGTSGVVNLAPGSSNNTKVQPGDLIVVAASTDRVAILGAVAKPGYFPLDAAKPLQLAQALADAGGTAPRAALTRATLTRKNGATVPLDLYALTILGDETQNLRLQSGDVVTIPEARGVTVFGAVTKPGTYTLEAATNPRVTDVIIAAGGLSVPAAQAFIRVERAQNSAAPGNSASTGLVAPVAVNDVLTRPGPATPRPKRSLADLIRENEARNGSTSVFGAPAPVPAGSTIASSTVGGSSVGNSANNNSVVGGSAFGVSAPTGILARNGANATDAGVLNARVFDGDRVTVEAIAAVRVTVTGEVKTQGAFEVAPGTTLVDVLARAGGKTSQASVDNITIGHADGSSEVFNVREALLRGAAAPPIRLRDGDYIVVARANNLIYVVGGVKISDYYAVPATGVLTLGESLSLAGGPVAGAQLNKIALIRSTPNGVQRTEVNLNQKNGELLNSDIPIRAGDVVFVPEANNKPSTLSNVLAAVSIFNPFRR